jgi:hypothetical protein
VCAQIVDRALGPLLHQRKCREAARRTRGERGSERRVRGHAIEERGERAFEERQLVGFGVEDERRAAVGCSAQRRFHLRHQTRALDGHDTHVRERVDEFHERRRRARVGDDAGHFEGRQRDECLPEQRLFRGIPCPRDRGD